MKDQPSSHPPAFNDAAEPSVAEVLDEAKRRYAGEVVTELTPAEYVAQIDGWIETSNQIKAKLAARKATLKRG